MARSTGGTAAERWRERLARWRDSGLSIREFCWREEVSQPSFYQWRKRLQRNLPSPRSRSAKPVFLPVQVVNSAGEATHLASLAGGGSRDAEALIEVVLPRGVTVRVAAQIDESRLRSVLRAVVAETGGC